jgi:hypothetical protein
MMYVSLVNRIEQNQSEHLQMSHFSTFHSQPEVSSRPRAQNTKRPRVTKDAFTAPKAKSDAFKVPKYKTVQNVVDDESEDQEEIDFTGVGPFYMGKFSVNGKGKEKKAIAAPQARSPKRRKVAHDFGFLETSLPHATTPASASDSAFAVPSSVIIFGLSVHAHFEPYLAGST